MNLLCLEPQISTGFVSRLFNYGSMFHFLSNDLTSMRNTLERAVNEDPEDKESWSNLGCIYFQLLEKQALATRCFDRAIKADGHLGELVVAG